MIALALLSILLAMAYMVFAHLLGTYDRTEEKWLAERNVQQTMRSIKEAISLSYEAQLSDDSAAALGKDDLRVLYLDGTDGSLRLRDLGEDGKPLADQRKLNELPVKVSFTNRDEAGAARGNILYITVSTAADSAVSYSLSSAVNLPNIAQSVTAPDAVDPPYSVVAFRTAEAGALHLSVGDMTGVGCFIATAAYGDYDAQNVQLLRRFRDSVLEQNELGRSFVAAYYRYSPPIAQTIARYPVLRFLVRMLLTPLIGVAVAVLHPAFSLAMAGFLAVFWRYYQLRRKSRPIR